LSGPIFCAANLRLTYRQAKTVRAAASEGSEKFANPLGVIVSLIVKRRNLIRSFSTTGTIESPKVFANNSSGGSSNDAGE
jgi:hypothetical protein